jgi:hypothetical protein
MYPVIFFDALRVEIRDEGTVKNKAVYLALAIQPPNGWRNLPQASWVKNYQRWSRAGEECGTKWCLSLLIQWRFAGSFTPPTPFQSLHMQLRKVLKTRGHFPNDEAATKLIYLALRHITKKWPNPPDHLEVGGNPVCHPIWRALSGNGSRPVMEKEKRKVWQVVAEDLNNTKACCSQLARPLDRPPGGRSRRLELTSSEQLARSYTAKHQPTRTQKSGHYPSIFLRSLNS